LYTFSVKKTKKNNSRGISKNPFFYFGLMSVVLFGLLFFSSDSLAELNYQSSGDITIFDPSLINASDVQSDDVFFSPHSAALVETPDLKIIQDNSIYAMATPSTLTTQTLGSIFGGAEGQRKEVVDYTVQIGDTIEGVARQFGISTNTVAWANDISAAATLKVGQTLAILPFSGLIYTVKNGDTLSQISKVYKSKSQETTVFINNIIVDNNLVNEGDIFIGDRLMLRDAVMPPKEVRSISVPLADNFFIFPSEGYISQRLHYSNGVDLANKCGTPIYAAAAGTVQRAVFNGAWNFGMGNYATILHSNGTVTYYGHLQTLSVKSGDKVGVGDRIGLMGRTGKATGCHIHFEVRGAQNPLARYLVGAKIQYK